MRTFGTHDRSTLEVVDVFAERGVMLAEAWQWWATTLTELDAVAWRRETGQPVERPADVGTTERPVPRR